MRIAEDAPDGRALRGRCVQLERQRTRHPAVKWFGPSPSACAWFFFSFLCFFLSWKARKNHAPVAVIRRTKGRARRHGETNESERKEAYVHYYGDYYIVGVMITWNLCALYCSDSYLFCPTRTHTHRHRHFAPPPTSLFCYLLWPTKTYVPPLASLSLTTTNTSCIFRIVSLCSSLARPYWASAVVSNGWGEVDI